MFIMFPSGDFLKILLYVFFSSASQAAQHQVASVATLGLPLVDTTAVASCVLFVASVQVVYCAAPV